ncbi:membrane protein DedA with SNARE-associated domain [Krasilnikovia cinnamomea]|uniref:Membrane protein DedA with SNARE-associated domain n=1 Tax=Krasilnikovia cinnamomea TaxID=349313 RepID=A0A4Q7ZRZ4_9ACTN|nr:VTT domain-containing protein [Krasilnikovia cinnamomea]RZU53614.1 membrane protein DedA with SNARE-associated domain [Krasilnikovia cinnamomea]
MNADAAHLLTALTESAWLLPAVFVLCAVDGVLPVVPGETVAIAAAVLAATGNLAHPAVIGVIVCASVVGDLCCYLLWRRAAAVRRTRSGRARAPGRIFSRVGALMDRRGGPAILAARFIPSGRTAASVAAALTGIPLRRFLLWTVAASAAWSAYITVLGYFGSRLTQGHPLYGVLLGVVAGAVVTLVVSFVGRRAGC